MIYVDTSALIALFVERNHATALHEFLGSRHGRPLATSTVGFIETVRTLASIGDFPAAVNALALGVTEIPLNAEVRALAMHIPGRLRTLDAIHVASAEFLGDALDVLVSYDKRMLDVARTAGLPTAAPGMGSP